MNPVSNLMNDIEIIENFVWSCSDKKWKDFETPGKICEKTGICPCIYEIYKSKSSYGYPQNCSPRLIFDRDYCINELLSAFNTIKSYGIDEIWYDRYRCTCDGSKESFENFFRNRGFYISGLTVIEKLYMDEMAMDTVIENRDCLVLKIDNRLRKTLG